MFCHMYFCLCAVVAAGFTLYLHSDPLRYRTLIIRAIGHRSTPYRHSSPVCMPLLGFTVYLHSDPLRYPTLIISNRT